MILILNKNRANLRGFTLLEAILAIFVTLVGTLAAYGLVQQVLASTYLSASKFTAVYLAKEGIEIVRNIRDTNWVEQETDPTIPWNQDLTGCAAGCEADYNAVLSPWSGTPLRLENATGLYGYGAGSDTKFKRKITIDDSVANILKVTVGVSWQEKGKNYQIIAQEILYEWWQ